MIRLNMDLLHNMKQQHSSINLNCRARKEIHQFFVAFLEIMNFFIMIKIIIERLDKDKLSASINVNKCFN